MFYNFTKWMNNKESPTHLDNVLIDLPTVQKELSLASVLQKKLLAEIRIATLTNADDSKKRQYLDELSECDLLVNFLNYSKTEVESKNEKLPLFLLGLNYLLSLAGDKQPANSQFKIQAMFSTLLSEDPTLTLGFYNQNKELFNTHKEIKQFIEQRVKLAEGTQKVKELYSRLEHDLVEQKNPLGLTPLFKNLISETEHFAGTILWLVNRGVPVENILQTQLLHDFMNYHLFNLDSADNDVDYLYKLLNQFPETDELIVQIRITSCGSRGFESYALDGKLQNTLALKTIEPRESVLEFSPVLANFNALHVLFGHSFLLAALSWGADSTNVKWLELLKICLNKINELPKLINDVAQENPKLLPLLTNLLVNDSLEQLIAAQNGALMHLLAYKPSLVNRIGAQNIAAFLEEIVSTSSSGYELVPQLSAMYKSMLRSKHSATELVFDKLIDCLYQNTLFLEDFDLLRQLKKFPLKAANLSLRSQNLWQLMEDTLTANTTEAAFTAQHFHRIEDRWLEISAKLRVLNEIQPSLDSDSYSKYTLYIRIAQRIFAQYGDDFNLDAFIAALELPDINTATGASLHERLYIEILSAIDNEKLRNALIGLLTQKPLNCVDWLKKNYGEQSLFTKATEHGNTGLLRLITENSEQSQADLEFALNLLISNQEVSSVNLLCQVLGEQLSRTMLIPTFIFSAQLGQLETIRQLSEIKNFQYLSNRHITQAIEQAVIGGHCYVVSYLCELPSYRLMKHTVDKFFKLANKFRNQDILTYLCSTDNPPMQVQIDKAFSMAVAANDLELVKCFCNFTNNNPRRKVIEKDFLFAASIGYLGIVKYLDSMAQHKLSQVTLDEALIRVVAIDQPAVTRYLQNKASKPAVCKALHIAIKAKQWANAVLLCNTSDTSKLKQAVNASLIVASKAGDLTSIQSICQLPIQPSKQTIENALLETISIGNMGVIHYLHSIVSLSQKMIDNLLLGAVKEQQPAIVSYLCEDLREKAPSLKAMKASLKKAVSTKQTDIADYLSLQISSIEDEQVEVPEEVVSKENRIILYPQLNNYGIFGKYYKKIVSPRESSLLAEPSENNMTM